MKTQIAAVAVLMIAMNGQAHGTKPEFRGLGDLEGGRFSSQAYAISGDGKVVVGFSSANTSQAFRWTATEGMVSLGSLSSTSSQAYDVSADGSVIVGSMDSPDTVSGAVFGEAFRWTQATGMVGLGALPGYRVDSRALGISGDGTVIVGGNRVSTGGTNYAGGIGS